MQSVHEERLEKAEVVEAVLEGMANGLTVAEVARKLKLQPGTVRKWMAEDEETLRRYQRARPMLGAAFAEEAIRVARGSTSATTATDRVLIETLKWAAAKAAPADYGDKQTVEHQGAQTVQIKVIEEEREVRNPKAIATARMVVEAAQEMPVLAPSRPQEADA